MQAPEAARPRHSSSRIDEGAPAGPEGAGRPDLAETPEELEQTTPDGAERTTPEELEQTSPDEPKPPRPEEPARDDGVDGAGNFYYYSYLRG